MGHLDVKTEDCRLNHWGKEINHLYEVHIQ